MATPSCLTSWSAWPGWSRNFEGSTSSCVLRWEDDCDGDHDDGDGESQFRGEYLKLRAQVRRYILSYKSVSPPIDVIILYTSAAANACDKYEVIRWYKVQEFVTGLVDATRTSYELEVILNHNPEGEPWQVNIINIANINIIIMVMITLNIFLNHNPDGEPWQVEIINITDVTIIIMIMITSYNLEAILTHNPDEK